MKKIIFGSLVLLLTGVFAFGVFASMAKITLKDVKDVGTLENWPHLKHQKNAKKAKCKACHKAMPGKKDNVFEKFTEAKKYEGCTADGACHDAKKLTDLATKLGILKK